MTLMFLQQQLLLIPFLVSEIVDSDIPVRPIKSIGASPS